MQVVCDGRRTISPRARAFTLVEVLIVVFILSVLAALAVPKVLSAMTESRAEAALVRGTQLYTLMVRYNQFFPSTAITLTDGPVAAADLNKLVTANYCAADDLVNQVDSTKGWSLSNGRLVPTP